MASNKNITMKQFNGTDYDTLYPKTVAAQIDDVYSKSEVYSKAETYSQSQLYTQAQTLTDATKTLYGLNSSAVPNDVFNVIKSTFDSSVKIATGTYVGTGKSGSSYPCSLTFSFAPKLVMIYQTGYIGIVSGSSASKEVSYYVILPNLTTSFRIISYINSDYREMNNTVTFSGNTISWYSEANNDVYAPNQLNRSGTRYGYIAIGGGD